MRRFFTNGALWRACGRVVDLRSSSSSSASPRLVSSSSVGLLNLNPWHMWNVAAQSTDSGSSSGSNVEVATDDSVLSEKKNDDVLTESVEAENDDNGKEVTAVAAKEEDARHEESVESVLVVEEEESELQTETSEEKSDADTKRGSKKQMQAKKNEELEEIKEDEDEGRGTAAELYLHIKSHQPLKIGKIPNASVIPLPTKRMLITVNRGPFIDKKSREQFDIKVHKRLVVIRTRTHKLREKLEVLKQFHAPGVQIKATFHYKTRFSWPLEATGLSDEEKWKMYNERDGNSIAKLAEDYKIKQNQVYDVLRSMEERATHIARFGNPGGDSAATAAAPPA